jgi:hypothetical protein
MLLQGLVIGTAGMALGTRTAAQIDAEHDPTSEPSSKQHDASSQWPSTLGYAMSCYSADVPT